MNCPKCGHEQTCPCKSCLLTTPTEKPWVNLPNDIVACGNCGYSLHCDGWLDVCWEEMKNKEKI